MKLKEYIEQTRVSPDDFAAKAGVSGHTIRIAIRGAKVSRWDTAKRISLATIQEGTEEPLVTIEELCE